VPQDSDDRISSLDFFTTATQAHSAEERQTIYAQLDAADDLLPQLHRAFPQVVAPFAAAAQAGTVVDASPLTNNSAPPAPAVVSTVASGYKRPTRMPMISFPIYTSQHRVFHRLAEFLWELDEADYDRVSFGLDDEEEEVISQ
jgi:hypothetical protein